MDDLFPQDPDAESPTAANPLESPGEGPVLLGEIPTDDEAERPSEEPVDEIDGFRDLALAAEGGDLDPDGREVTSAPSDADQSEAIRIATEAVESGPTPERIATDEAGGGPNHPDSFLSPGSTGSSPEPPAHRNRDQERD